MRRFISETNTLKEKNMRIFKINSKIMRKVYKLNFRSAKRNEFHINQFLSKPKVFNNSTLGKLNKQVF